MHTPQQLHQSYQDATGYELAINAYTERLWYEASRWGITPDDVKLVIKARIKRNLTQTIKSSLMINRLIGDECDLAQFTNELAAIRAEMRKPRYDAGKTVVLRATHRPTEPAQADARSAQDVIKALRDAALLATLLFSLSCSPKEWHKGGVPQSLTSTNKP